MRVSTIIPLLLGVTSASVLPRQATVSVPVATHTAISDTDIAARPVGVQTSLPGPTGSCSVFLPFLNVDQANIDAGTSFPDHEGPRVMVAVDDVDIYTKGVILDTGSTGMTIGKDRWVSWFGKDWNSNIITPKTSPGWKYLSSSDRLYKGFWVNVKLTFKDARGGNSKIQAHVPVLVYNETQICSATPTTTGECPVAYTTDPALSGVYLGIGYGRRDYNNIQLTPDKNLFVNVDAIWQASGLGTTCDYRNGYKITKTGITWGLTTTNTANFKFHQLAKFPGSTEKYDWNMSPACIGVNALTCRQGLFLPDTGITGSYISHPDVPLIVADRQPPTTTYRLNLPDAAFGMGHVDYLVQYSGTLGAVEPDSYGVTRTTGADPRVYINTGSHFWNRFETVYDADRGFYGVRSLV